MSGDWPWTSPAETWSGLIALAQQGFNGRYGRWGHVFGERFWCKPVPEEQLETVCIYVMMNPVRAGRCEQINDWPWSARRFELG
jgi:hypothetical protein